MDSPTDRLSERSKKAVRGLGATLSNQQILNFAQIRDLISTGRATYNVPLSVSLNQILQFLIGEKLLKKVVLDFPSRKETRYICGKVHPLEMAATLGRDAYFSHLTALHLHKLVRPEPSQIYVNSEQSEKPQPDADLSQESIDTAFQRKPRLTTNFIDYNGRTICLLNGKHTGGLGVTTITWKKNTKLRVTDLERTLIDATVRPQYSAGVSTVLAAFGKAGRRVSIARIVRYLDELNHVYPYHQSIGFYLEESGHFTKRDLLPLAAKPRDFDFYLTHGMKATGYSEQWRVHFPKEMPR